MVWDLDQEWELHGIFNPKSKIYMKKAKRDPKSFHFDKKKFGKK